MALCTRPPTNTHLTAASAGRRLHFIPKSRGAAPQLADSLEDKHRRRWGTSGSSFPPNQRQGTLDLCPAPPPAKHTPLRGTWRPGRGPEGMEHVCACLVADSLGLAQKSGLWGARASLHGPARPRLPESAMWGDQGREECHAPTPSGSSEQKNKE